MTLSQVADLAYVIKFEELERTFQAVEIAYYSNITEETAKTHPPPDFQEMFDDFNRQLHAEFKAKQRSGLEKFFGLG
jgi:hypothetical protein